MAPSPTIRRLLKETSELSSSSSNPNPAFNAAPVSEADLHEWHFTLLGPPSPSPYAGGLYHGRISLPPSYPLKPPNFRFLTPSGRFEVNREICLSISGFHEETWMPAWGVRTALTALRSFMAESGTAGQVGGLEASKEVRERLAKESRTWKCADCGSRTNEEIMSEWWAACANKGVKVGEDVGLEVLPEGLSLEAKIPQGREPKGKAKEGVDEVGTKQSTARVEASEGNDKGQPSVMPLSSLPKVQAESIPLAASITTTTTTPSLDTTSQLPPPVPDIRQPTNPPTHGQAPPHQSNSRPNPSVLRQIPLVDPPLPFLTNNNDRHRRPTEDDASTVTIDRAIYVVFVALLLMCVKKIFYPAGNGSGLQWEDFAMIRE